MEQALERSKSELFLLEQREQSRSESSRLTSEVHEAVAQQMKEVSDTAKVRAYARVCVCVCVSILCVSKPKCARRPGETNGRGLGW